MVPQLQVGQLRVGVVGASILGLDVVVVGRNIEVIHSIKLSCRKAVGVASVAGASAAMASCDAVNALISVASRQNLLLMFAAKITSWNNSLL